MYCYFASEDGIFGCQGWSECGVLLFPGMRNTFFHLIYVNVMGWDLVPCCLMDVEATGKMRISLAIDIKKEGNRQVEFQEILGKKLLNGNGCS